MNKNSKKFKNLIFSENVSKSKGEMFFVVWSVLVLILLSYIIVTKRFLYFEANDYMKTGLFLFIPCVLIPLLCTERHLKWHQKYSTKANCFFFILAWISNYFWTNYFYSVLGVSYTFPAWRFNDVPFCLYLMSHSYFAFYHTIATLSIRTFSKFVSKNKVFSFVVIIPLSLVLAFFEAYSLKNFPYYSFENERKMYTVGTVFYSIYFIVTFPVFYRIDEKVGECWALETVITEALASCMAIFQLLDFWRLFIGKIY
ncbi:hypothetical protein MHBO_002978 [Bonamia ostreae]|uniref:Cycloeucalenol cycloisomerase n=1 Tax=Bonamia ostreae TaxID=126728 RepID=A0ABV2AP40_9EUKA